MSAPILTPLEDVLAYLAKHRDAARTVLSSDTPDEEALAEARGRARLAQTAIDDFKAGIHLGDAEVRKARGLPDAGAEPVPIKARSAA